MVIALRASTGAQPQPFADKASMAQVAALCHREADDGMEILLITSSNGRWILPKGWPMDDRSDAEAARQEAWEEAGVKEGSIAPDPVGSYVGAKAFENGASALCDTTVYAIDVAETVDEFPESDWRKRKWVALEDAPAAVDDPDLEVFLKQLQPVSDTD